MHRKLLRAFPAAALVALFWSGHAAAQSSAQLYGDVDAFVGAKKALGGQTAVMLGNGGSTASFWGIKGAEDLGGGDQAVFELESYFSVQNGTFGRFAGDGFFSRNAWVGVSAPWGKLLLGQIGPLYWNSTIFYNPFFNSFVFSPAVIHTYVPVNGQGVGGGRQGRSHLDDLMGSRRDLEGHSVVGVRHVVPLAATDPMAIPESSSGLP